MILFPNSKINLGLYVKEKRNDGYHEIETCLYPIPLCDALEIILSKETQFTVTGREISGNVKDNLILRAYERLKKDFSDLPPINIHLHKVIPTGAGLGGGSADAASALKLMNELFDLFLEPWLLEDYAAELGSDCPFFIEGTPKVASGRGEILNAITLDLKGKWMVLIHPDININTREAYSNIKPKPPINDLTQVLADPACWREQLTNDFEESIFKAHPQIARVKDRLYQSGAFYSAMSGSGSAVFGLFDQEPPKEDWPQEYFVFVSEL